MNKTLDGHRANEAAAGEQQWLAKMPADMSRQCRVHVTLRGESSSGGHRFKLTGAWVPPYLYHRQTFDRSEGASRLVVVEKTLAADGAEAETGLAGVRRLLRWRPWL